MIEIEKLRQRLSNVGKNTVEYKMTVVEAKKLLSEIDIILTPAAVTVEKVQTVITRIMDGGEF
jgi:hypothetical protein